MRSLDFLWVSCNVWYVYNITEDTDRTVLSSMPEVTATYKPIYIILHVLINVFDTLYVKGYFSSELYNI